TLHRVCQRALLLPRIEPETDTNLLTTSRHQEGLVPADPEEQNGMWAQQVCQGVRMPVVGPKRLAGKPRLRAFDRERDKSNGSGSRTQPIPKLYRIR
ncbi:hypothetical protein K0M31_012698, partial [Melipona bicolor]